jgi:hypothetical protein
MTGPADEALWRNRFIFLNLVRIGFTALVLFGLFVWQTDWLEPGGSTIGLVMALAGLAGSFGGPIWLARRWKTPPTP